MGCILRIAAIVFCLFSIAAARAEVNEIVIAQQYGVSFLPLMVMEKNQLVKRHAREAGLTDLKRKWVSRNPNVKTIKDFSESDKIAVPSVKISTQAVMLQMAAAKAFGEKNFAKLDPLTVSLSHPDATLAFTNNTAGVNAHFSSSPFCEQEIKVPGLHFVTTNYEILGGPATAVVIIASGKFREGDPKVYRAFLDALKEVTNTMNKDKSAAAKLYLEAAHDTKDTVESITAIISDKDYAYTLQPHKVLGLLSSWRRSARSSRLRRELTSCSSAT
jgi:sulfonate transport system substrate-binding protein